MSDILPRLKPDPIPAINAPAEYLVKGNMKRDYEDTKNVLQVPWMGVVAMAFAAYRNLYGVFWPAFRETFGGAALVKACAELRSQAEDAVLALNPPPIVTRLEALGYAPREISQIRDMIEVFSHGNCSYCFMATMNRLLLEGQEIENRAAPEPFPGRHAPQADVPFVLFEMHHADQPTRETYDDIKTLLGLPFVNTDYRALSRWPSYFSLAWNDLRGHVQTYEYEAVVTGVHTAYVDASLLLPNPEHLTAATLQAAAEKDGGLENALETVRLFQWLLPGLIINVAYLRAQFTVQ